MVVPAAASRRTTGASASLIVACMTAGTTSAFCPSPKPQHILPYTPRSGTRTRSSTCPHSRLKLRPPATSPLFLASNNDDEQDEGYTDGEALAAEFYDLVRSKESSASDNEDDDGKRAERAEYRRLLEQQRRIDEQEERDQDQQQKQKNSQPPGPKSPLTPEEESEIRARDAFSSRKEMSVSKDGVVQSSGSSSASNNGRKKFTGAASSNVPPRLDSTGSPSAGLFSGRGGSVFSYPDGSMGAGPASASGGDAAAPAGDARSRMMQREFNLVSWASGAGFYALAALLAVSLVGVLYVGATGGITDGSERFVEASEFNVIGDFTAEGNGITPDDWKNAEIPSKMEGTSVWL